MTPAQTTIIVIFVIIVLAIAISNIKRDRIIDMFDKIRAPFITMLERRRQRKRERELDKFRDNLAFFGFENKGNKTTIKGDVHVSGYLEAEKEVTALVGKKYNPYIIFPNEEEHDMIELTSNPLLDQN